MVFYYFDTIDSFTIQILSYCEHYFSQIITFLYCKFCYSRIIIYMVMCSTIVKSSRPTTPLDTLLNQKKGQIFFSLHWIKVVITISSKHGERPWKLNLRIGDNLPVEIIVETDKCILFLTSDFSCLGFSLIN